MKLVVPLLVLSLLFMSLPGLALAAEFGIDRSNLTRQKKDVQQRTLADIHSLHAAWFRDVLVTAPEPIPAFIEELRMVKQNDLKFLANVLPANKNFPEGYTPPNAGEDFRKRCGWHQGSSELSKMDVTKFTRGLCAQLDAVKAAGLSIDAFEIGNEVDWICFNGDVPNGRVPTQQDWMTAVRGYARFLKAAAEVIRDPRYFPGAKIITFGIAHGSDQWDKPLPHHFANPARLVAMLRNLDGFNYLDNNLYHVDGYGSHVYPNPNNLQQSVTNIIRPDVEILGTDKPFWITEWGMGAASFPNKQGQSRGDAIRQFYAILDGMHVPFGPTFYYAYNLLVDANGALLPEAEALSARLRAH